MANKGYTKEEVQRMIKEAIAEEHKSPPLTKLKKVKK